MEPQIINCFAAFRDGSLQRKFPLHSSSQAVPTAPNPLPSVLMNQTKPEMQRHNVYLFSQSTRVCLQLWEVNIKWCSWDEETDAVLGLKLSFLKHSGQAHLRGLEVLQRKREKMRKGQAQTIMSIRW